MFVIPTVAVLFVFVYMRPHELWEAMRLLNVNLVTILVAFGFVIDLRIGTFRPRVTALLITLLVLFAWCLLTVAIKAPDRLNDQLVIMGISLIAFVAVSQGLQSLRAIEVAASLLLVLTLALAAMGVYQALQPKVCIALHSETTSLGPIDVPDGRDCNRNADCEEGGLPEHDYMCEHPGLLGTHSIGGRVRFRGILEDPNELAWAIAMGMPLAFALVQRRRTRLRMVVLAATLIVGTICVVYSESRSGQIALMASLAVYFVRRFGWKGAVVGAVAALPLLYFGGRSGEEADSSSLERMGCWSEALGLWHENPFIGVGNGQFLEHHYLTAHNSFMLTLAELGPPGLLLWSTAIYLAFKILIRIQLDLGPRPEAAVARTWAMALLSSMVGLAISAFFLSLAYHTILWIFLGLVGAVYGAVRKHDPDFRVRFGLRDMAAVFAGDVFIVVSLSIYLRLKGI
jgi:O-Antigen ligase